MKDYPEFAEKDKDFLPSYDATCSAYLSTNQFKNFFECMDEMESKNFRYAFEPRVGFRESPGWIAFPNFGKPINFYPANHRDIRSNRLKAEAYFRLGDFHNTIHFGKKGVEIAKTLEGSFDALDEHVSSNWKHPWAADVLATSSYVAQAYLKLDRYTEAEHYLNIAETIHREADGNEVDVSFARLRRAFTYPIYLSMNKTDNLEISSKTAQEWAQQAAGVGLIIVAGLAGNSGQNLADQGVDLIQDANISDTDWLRERVQNARVYRVKQDHSNAIDAYTDALDDSLMESLQELHWITLYERAVLYTHNNQPQLAERDLIKAVDLIELNRGNISTESHKIGFAGSKEKVYQTLIALLLENGKNELAFEYVERSKARALVDMLADSSFKGQEVKGFDASIMLAMNDAATNLLTSGSADSNDQSVRALKRARNEVKKKDPVMASLLTVDPLKAQELKSLLSSDETLVEFYESSNGWKAFVVSKNNVDVVHLPIQSKDLSESVFEFRKAVLDHKSNRYKKPAKAMYQHLWKPLKDKVKTKKVTIVAHGSLHYLPWNALMDGHQFMIDQHELRLLPSLQALKYIKANTGNQKTLVFGNPTLDLAGAEKESKVLASQVTGDLYLRENATESVFKQVAQDYGRVHIASHGEFNALNPMNSRLLLAPGKGQDGSLTLAELYGLKLNADLVVMSACETALSDIANGDDLIGLNRGFLYAGARSIISSLWLVDDAATKDLMLAFYDELDSADKAKALRKAQLTIKKNRNNHHPYYWSAFQLTGRI